MSMVCIVPMGHPKLPLCGDQGILHQIVYSDACCAVGYNIIAACLLLSLCLRIYFEIRKIDMKYSSIAYEAIDERRALNVKR